MNTILERVNEVCVTVRDNCPEPVGFKKLIGLVRSTFKNHDFNILIKTKKEKDLDVDKFYVMAYYDAYEDNQGEIPIEVFVHHNLDGGETFGKHQVINFLIEIYDAVVHEFKHRQQSLKRNHKEYTVHIRSPYNEYLSNTDEIDAYALSIAIEMLRTMTKERAKKYMTRLTLMSKMRKGTAFAIPMLRAYLGEFGFESVVKKLSKKIYKHLDQVDSKLIFK